MNRLLLLFVFILGSGVAFAQQMNDDQVVEYVMSAQEKGCSQQEIAAELLRRGVTNEQINRIKRKMNSQDKTGIGKTLGEKSRMRSAYRENGTIELQGDKNAVSLEDGIGFLFSDSTMYVEKVKKEIFGHRIFQNKEVAFEAAYNLPTPSNYTLGPGDEVAIDVWGASEYSIQEVISPDGNIYIEGLGPVYLSGLR